MPAPREPCPQLQRTTASAQRSAFAGLHSGVLRLQAAKEHGEAAGAKAKESAEAGKQATSEAAKVGHHSLLHFGSIQQFSLCHTLPKHSTILDASFPIS